MRVRFGVARAGLIGLAGMLASPGCGDDARKAPGAMCAINTDCYSPYKCAYGRCHEECRSSRDCPSGHDCVRGPEAPVCQLESVCHYLSECQPPLECALNRRCRSQCLTDVDCPGTTQKCLLPDGVCAEMGDINPTSNGLKNAQTQPVPDRPDGGDAGPADGGVGDAAGPGTDAPADGRADTVADVPVEMPPTGEPGPCGFPEPGEPNDVREMATPLTVGTDVSGCIASQMETDFFELTGPPAGTGYFQVSLLDVGPDRLRAQFFTASDNNLIHDPLVGNIGGSLFFYFAAAPGQKYRLQLTRGQTTQAPFRYTVRTSFTAVVDADEPNDTRAAAALVTVGVPTTAYMFNGFTVGQLAGWSGRQGEVAYADWYKVALLPGKATFKVENSAADVRLNTFFYDALGREDPAGRSDGGPGGGTSITVTIPTADTYHFQLAHHPPGPIAAGATMTVSPSFTMPYTLTVTQLP